MAEVSVQPLDLNRPEWGRAFVVPWDTDIFRFPVGTYTPTSGANQRWTLIDETVLRTGRVRTHTVPKLAPRLPETVTPVYRDGARGSLPVVWDLPPERVWRKPGEVRVTGVATDPLGGEHRATALVTVDTFVRTLPARAPVRADIGSARIEPWRYVRVGLPTSCGHRPRY